LALLLIQEFSATWRLHIEHLKVKLTSGREVILDPATRALRTLEKVSVTVSSNIHLNSFMYEPILDLTVEHLIDLYT
jgi:hypothetical protein